MASQRLAARFRRREEDTFVRRHFGPHRVKVVVGFVGAGDKGVGVVGPGGNEKEVVGKCAGGGGRRVGASCSSTVA